MPPDVRLLAALTVDQERAVTLVAGTMPDSWRVRVTPRDLDRGIFVVLVSGPEFVKTRSFPASCRPDTLRDFLTMALIEAPPPARPSGPPDPGVA